MTEAVHARIRNNDTMDTSSVIMATRITFWDDDHSLLSAFPNSASSVGNLLNALAMAAASTARMASFSACNSINILAIALASPARMGS
ncbi:unnamed protein product [Arabidopsis thaliana]|uniref:Uncharacterized protein n=1 Tax=Arabidopsis thaliana TaxID=3702 RepID=A0A5S9YEX1_ARATH|nr:unnamed protein product [Arabidopsis thaliana]